MSEENMININKADSSFIPTFVDHPSHITRSKFQWALFNKIKCLSLKSNKSRYFLETKSTIKKFKQRICIKYLLMVSVTFIYINASIEAMG